MHLQIAIGSLLLIITTFVHAGFMLAALWALRTTHADRWGLRTRWSRVALVAALVLMMFVAGLLEATIWAQQLVLARPARQHRKCLRHAELRPEAGAEGRALRSSQLFIAAFRRTSPGIMHPHENPEEPFRITVGKLPAVAVRMAGSDRSPLPPSASPRRQNQSSTRRPLTRSKCLRLCVTSVNPRDRACAATIVSSTPIGTPSSRSAAVSRP